MDVSILYTVLLLLACGYVKTQDVEINEAILTPEEIIEGSGDVPVELRSNIPLLTQAPALEEPETTEGPSTSCPEVCTCSTEGEGDSFSFIVDCSNKNMDSVPSNIDVRATSLNLQDNKINVVPKSLTELKNLKTLNLANNDVTEISAGAISELLELKVLKLSNNRLLEYPVDLKNSFSLTKLEEIYLNGNDIRSGLTAENFSTFKSLRTLVLPETNIVEVNADELCSKISTLESVCLGSCEQNTIECTNELKDLGEEYLDVTTEGDSEVTNATNTEPSVTTAEEDTTPTPVLRRAEITNGTVEADGEAEVKVGATTSDTNTGAVDKRVIGIVVIGMVAVVAVIALKKNWGAIRKRFGSNTETNVVSGPNGVAPEEMPLQDKEKSPV